MRFCIFDVKAISQTADSKHFTGFRFAFVCGASNQLCGWLRIPKLLSSSIVLLGIQKNSAMESRGPSSRKKILLIVSLVLSVVHIGACIWFFIGSQYQVPQQLPGSYLRS